ncbi:Undecaprenyl-phosphate mannosyltransferase [Clavibacter michiganensis]|uniref:Undecaprenyl-phosphate mannosyltransferase n=1 Tax=Clavibacter michiganensis TaxID=28447 RepID=A0A251YEC3_9MICO|nr:glycosyltransferase family 2 protein [Clavibacter michiganensis]OUE22503.1 Undecaprenyl-phosphate mannosyltransferase [Clavibacter michiganensis]
MTVAALVVSHDRVDLLRLCLERLSRQTRPLDDIIVVDNQSSDGTVEMVAAEFPDVILLHTQANLGGAGGFSAGLEHAIQRGYDYVWLMDDDAYPEPDALAPLVAAIDRPVAGDRPGFVACEVLSPDGIKDDPWKYPKPHRSITTSCPTPPGTVPVGFAVFVGVLINVHVARRTYLPVGDFFIWWDDTEYTSRLQRLAGGFYHPGSVIRHPIKPELDDLKGRLRHDLRNRIWIIRDDRLGSRTALAKARGQLWTRIWTQARDAESKLAYLRNLSLGLYEGLFTRPRVRMPVTPELPSPADSHDGSFQAARRTSTW